MSDLDPRLKGLELLARHEEAIGELYLEYSKRFPDHKEFWLRLYREEKKHAELVRELFPKVLDGTVKIAPDRVKPEAIEGSIKRVRGWTLSARAVDPDLGDALGNAQTIENSLIEKSYYRLNDDDGDDIKKTFTALVEGSREHRRKVVGLLNAHNEMRP